MILLFMFDVLDCQLSFLPGFWSRGYKTFFMLINVKMPTIVGILTQQDKLQALEF